MDISGNPVLGGNPATGIGSQNITEKDQPTIWGRMVKVVLPVLSIAGVITGIALALTVAPIAGAVIAVASAALLVGKCLYDRSIRSTAGENPEPKPRSYVQKPVSANRPVPLSASGVNEQTCLPSLDVMKELPAGASGAKVYQVRDQNKRSMVLKIHRHGRDVLPNFLWNEGRVQQQVSKGTRNLLPVVHHHGTITGEKLTALINDPSFIRRDEQYTVILSDYIEHKSLLDLASSSSNRPSSHAFRCALSGFARNMRHAVRTHQFEHNDLSHNLIYTSDGKIMLIDTGLSATRDYVFQGKDKGNPFMNIQAALDIAYKMAGSKLNDPFYRGMKIENGLQSYWNSIINRNDSVDFDLLEFNTVLLYFPDIRQKIIPGGNPTGARLLNWDECIAALEASPGHRAFG